MSKSADLLQEQIEYYRERALEYDEWFFRQGRYDRGEAHRKQWFAEIAEIEELLRTIQLHRHTLFMDRSIPESHSLKILPAIQVSSLFNINNSPC